MSTKIYNGYRAKKFDTFEVADAIRAVVEPMFHESYVSAYETATKNVGKNWDQVFPALFPRTKIEPWQVPIPASPWARADMLYELIVALKNVATRTFSDLDFAYDISLLPNRGDSKKPLVMVFGQKDLEYGEALVKAGVVTDYGYWDNTDWPDGMTSRQWAERKRAWGVLLGSPDKTPSEAGLSIEYPIKMTTTWNVLKPVIARGEA